MSDDAKARLRRAHELRQQLAAILDPLDAREHIATEALATYRDEQLARALMSIPLERLREVTDDRLRIAALADVGFTSVFDVYRRSAAELDAIPNIGTQSAMQLAAAAEQVARAVRRSTATQLDPRVRTPAATNALGAVARWDALRRVTNPVRNAARALLVQLDGAIAAARPARSNVRMLFTWGARRHEVQDGLAQLGDVLTAPATRALQTRVEELLPSVASADRSVLSDAELWQHYERDAATFNAAIDSLQTARRPGAPNALRAVDPRGRVPADIAARIEAFTLDTSYLRASLRGYQEFGAQFALVQERVILGDEMGLGKTVQAIAAMAHLQANGEAHHLVVCPATVLVNWAHEIEKHSDLLTFRVHGEDRDATLATWVRDGGVAVTTFETLRALMIPDDVEIALVVVDEAHYVKNAEAQRSRAVQQLARRQRRVLLMSGTPMENRIDEFATLVGYLRPELTASLDRAAGVAGADAFRAAVASVYLRRNQDDVLTELPERIDNEAWVAFTADDAVAYRAAVRDGNFMAMRRAAFVVNDVERNAKLGRLAQILAEAADNDAKVVVFSFFLDVLETVAELGGAFTHGPITGSVSPEDRQRMVDEFSATNGYAVLVSQIQAGGVGLNIQAASVVVLTEPQWKPSTEEQAIARAHRMGQTRPVQVHRLLAEDSVDALLVDIVRKKTALFDAYARESDLKDVAPGAVDVSEARAAQQIIEAERVRLALEP